MARFLVKYRVGATTYERTLDLNWGGEGEAKDALCRMSSSYRDAVILGVRPA